MLVRGGIHCPAVRLRVIADGGLRRDNPKLVCLGQQVEHGNQFGQEAVRLVCHLSPGWVEAVNATERGGYPQVAGGVGAEVGQVVGGTEGNGQAVAGRHVDASRRGTDTVKVARGASEPHVPFPVFRDATNVRQSGGIFPDKVQLLVVEIQSFFGHDPKISRAVFEDAGDVACFRAGRGYGDGGREAELHALPFGTKNSGQERRGQPCAVPVARRDDEVHFQAGVDAQRDKVVCARSHVVERQPVAFLVEPQDAFPVFVHAVEVGIEAELLLDERESVVPDGIGVEGQVIPGIERAEPQVAFTVFQDGGKHAVVVERRGEGGGDKAAIGSAVEDVEGIVGKHP